MARDSQAALVALNRFGLGARGGASGDFVNAASDPRGFVKAELNRPKRRAAGSAGTAVHAGAGPDRVRLSVRDRAGAQRRRQVRRAETGRRRAGHRRQGRGDGGYRRQRRDDSGRGDAAPKPVAEPPNIIQKTYRAEALARLQRAMIADCGFTERLVVFWSNHFCISANKGGLARMWAGSFEREAIRPHVLGRFGDMLKAVEQHPAMLFFLDNQQSLGPESRAGQNRKRGLNENLAREIMELHTLGVGGGYSQDDVTSLARIITGWTYAGRLGQLGMPGTFAFNANAHQPGAQRLLGKTYEDTGVAQGEAALADLARHPSTAKFIAAKFARHFVADDPPPALVARLRDVFGKSDGDLKALAIALLDSDEAWQMPMTKMRSPYEFLVATGRLLGRVPEDPGRYSRRPEPAGPAAVVSGRAERISGQQRRLGRARGHEAAARHLGAGGVADRRNDRCTRSA